MTLGISRAASCVWLVAYGVLRAAYLYLVEVPIHILEDIVGLLNVLALVLRAKIRHLPHCAPRGKHRHGKGARRLVRAC